MPQNQRCQSGKATRTPNPNASQNTSCGLGRRAGIRIDGCIHQVPENSGNDIRLKLRTTDRAWSIGIFPLPVKAFAVSNHYFHASLSIV